MSSFDRYATPVAAPGLEIAAAGSSRFSWEYDDGRERLLALYQKGKDKQWDATKRIDWSLEVDPARPLGLPEETCPIYGSEQWNKLGPADRDELGKHLGSWQFSQFLHGEQGAMICSARIVESVPDLDSKFYAATQTMDEARHAETYARFLQEKVGLLYPINPYLEALLKDTLDDSRWDMPYLGMQVLIEGLALAAFGLLRDIAQTELPKQILAYVMQDEARHVAFGRLALRDYYKELTRAELAEREDFVVEGCYLMRSRFRAQEVWENFGFDVAECLEYTENSEMQQAFRSLLFSRIVPCVKDIGLWGDRVQKAYADLGVLDMAGINLEDLMNNDENVAEALDAERRELSARRAEIDDTIAAGAAAG
ncbi:MAG TPA: ferritin-like domain-containing protein [Mycobacteriales bacterium]|nr:ferritin-like domain-containing protein [Mycobacteriales bacterium]